MARAILGPHYENYSKVLTAEDEAVLNQLQAKYKASQEGAAVKPAETVVDPWSVVGAVDYNHLSRDFGSVLICDALIDRWNFCARAPFQCNHRIRFRWQRIMGPEKPMHPWIRRGIFFSHRDLYVYSHLLCSLSVSHSSSITQRPNSRLCGAWPAFLLVYWPRAVQRVAPHGASCAISVHKMASGVYLSVMVDLASLMDFCRTFSTYPSSFSSLMTRSSFLNRSSNLSNVIGWLLKTPRT